MAFGIICDRCGQVCDFKNGDVAYEVRLYKTKDIQHSTLDKANVFVCLNCQIKLNKFLNNEKV